MDLSAPASSFKLLNFSPSHLFGSDIWFWFWMHPTIFLVERARLGENGKMGILQVGLQ
jgi:hypothetical protein